MFPCHVRQSRQADRKGRGRRVGKQGKGMVLFLNAIPLGYQIPRRADIDIHPNAIPHLSGDISNLFHHNPHITLLILSSLLTMKVPLLSFWQPNAGIDCNSGSHLWSLRRRGYLGEFLCSRDFFEPLAGRFPYVCTLLAAAIQRGVESQKKFRSWCFS